MLAFTRKAKQSFTVNGPARIIVTRVRGGKVSVAVEAAREVTILRGELVDAPTHPDTKSPKGKAA